ncbi:MAG: alpha/beta fold hydrolase, partial [Motiliproteus sp.]|nr:alpha/beta fold hydrolase [Motiliproteus sp.]
MKPAEPANPSPLSSASPNSVYIPSAKQLLALSGITPADNPLDFKTAIHWKSDLSALWLQGVYHWQRLCDDAEHSPWLPSTWGHWAKLSQQWADQCLLAPIRQQLQQAAHNATQPDMFRLQNDEIERRYANLLKQLCELCMEQGQFSTSSAKRVFSDATRSMQLLQVIFQLTLLEQNYNSLGLTRLTALKELYKTLLMVITASPLDHPHPYRRYTAEGEPKDSFEDYLETARQRFQCLLQADAFDLVLFSEQPCGKIGCRDYQLVTPSDADSDLHGVRLRYYPAQSNNQDSPNTNAVLYLNSPLINQPEIYDLAPGKSVVEGMTDAGFDVYLVDYSNADGGSNKLGLDFFGKVVHDHFISEVKRRHPEQPLHMMGYCMGGTLILPYLARRAEEREKQGLDMDIQKVLLMATPVRFDDESSGHKPMRDLIRTWYDPDMLKDLLGDEKVPPQLIESGMNQIQPGVRYTVTKGFFERANNLQSIRDAAPFLNWLNHGTSFPAQAHRQWIANLFMGNQLWQGKYCLPSTVEQLDGQPVDMKALK